MTTRLAVLLATLALLGPRAAVSSEPEHLRFAVIGDPQLGMVELERDTQRFARVVDAIASLPATERPRLVLIAGDLVNKAGDAAQLRRFAEVKAKLRLPVLVVPGNHDVAEDGRTLAPALLARFRREVAPDRRVMRHGGSVFIALDSQLWFTDTTAAEQLEWLGSQLRKAGRMPVFVLQHHPVFVEAADEADAYWNVPRTWRERVLALFEKSNVRAVLTGHLHRNRVNRWRDIVLLTTPSTAKNFDDSPLGYRVIDVDGKGNVTEGMRSVEGTAR